MGEKSIIKVKDGKTATVVEALNKLERELTPEKFKSITADNGSEFMDFEGLELSENKKYKRFDLYFAHQYRSAKEELMKITMALFVAFSKMAQTFHKYLMIKLKKFKLG